MKRLPITLLLFALSCLPFAATAQDQTPQEAAEEWVALIDSGEYAASYQAAADSIFKTQLTEDEWVRIVGVVREERLPSLQRRSFVDVQQLDELPNAPAGQYAIVRYESRYGEVTADEVVTLVLEEGRWKPAGYAVRPQQ